MAIFTIDPKCLNDLISAGFAMDSQTLTIQTLDKHRRRLLASVVSRRSTSKRQRCKFKEEWKETYLMWPNESEGYMTCILCSEKLTSFKASTITRHIERKHKQSRHFTPDKRQRLISTFQRGLLRQQQLLKKATYS